MTTRIKMYKKIRYDKDDIMLNPMLGNDHALYIENIPWHKKHIC